VRRCRFFSCIEVCANARYRQGDNDNRMIECLSLAARVTLALHNLNSEGFEGNHQQTRVAHIIDSDGKRHAVNAISGDMFKHIYVQHLTAILQAQGQPLSAGAAVSSPDRITVDPDFKEAIKGRTAAEVQNEMLVRCAVTDIAGTLFTVGITVARKSCIEFGWLTGIPEQVQTEQYFHVKYEADRRKANPQAPRGAGTIAGSQTVFHRPASSGIYALICHLELSRIGRNDVTRQPAISPADQATRRLAAVQALLSTLVRPNGAQCNTQSPHIVKCSGILTISRSYLPAPMLSPIAEHYRAEITSVAQTLNRLTPDAIDVRAFEELSSAIEALERLGAEV